MPELGISTAFDALFILIALIQIGHCLHLFRLSTPLKSSTWLLLVGGLCYVSAYSASIAADVAATKLIGPIRPSLIKAAAWTGLIEQSLSLGLAGGILSTLGFALVSACIFCTIAAAEESKVKTPLWVGVGMVAISAVLDVASLSYSHGVLIAALNTSPALSRSSPVVIDKAVVLGLGISAFVFQIAFLGVLGKVGRPYKEHAVRLKIFG